MQVDAFGGPALFHVVFSYKLKQHAINMPYESIDDPMTWLADAGEWPHCCRFGGAWISGRSNRFGFPNHCLGELFSEAMVFTCISMSCKKRTQTHTTDCRNGKGISQIVISSYFMRLEIGKNSTLFQDCFHMTV